MHPWLSREFENPIPESPLNKKIKLIKAYQNLTKVFLINYLNLLLQAFATLLSLTILTTNNSNDEKKGNK